MSEARHIAIIGGGAAGLAAAIAAARSGAEATIFEAENRVGQKILKTGNGRCNLTNMRVTAADYNAPDFVAPMINAWPGSRVREFFDSLGMMSFEENEGRVYPLSNFANTVLNVLRFECERLNVRMLCDHKVTNIQSDFTVNCENGTSFQADRVIVTTGGGTELLAGMGHQMVPFQPVLCPLKTDTKYTKGLSGIRTKVSIRAYNASGVEITSQPYSGELLFRDYGLSGIVIFDLSRLVQEGDWLSLDFLPYLPVEALASWLTSRFVLLNMHAVNNSREFVSYSELLTGLLHGRLNDALVRSNGLKAAKPVRAELLPDVARSFKDFRVQVLGVGDASQAQVTRGGAALDEFDAVTLQSKLHDGLYAAGEALDVDGRCGGFNLHWAWASGVTAGTQAAR